MVLDIEFIIFSSILIGAIIPLYIYRQKIFSFAYKTGSMEIFIRDVKLHLKKDHPKINFDYSIIEKTSDEKDIRVRQTIIVEDLVSQYFTYDYLKVTQGTIAKDKLWTNYEEKSKSNAKTPSDWSQRRELAWNRDHEKCNRCGTKSKLNDSMNIFVKDISDGGGYNVENIITLCSDCYRIINSKNHANTMATLNLHDKLMVFVEA